jgi:hypothetical protein
MCINDSEEAFNPREQKTIGMPRVLTMGFVDYPDL